uniref:Uncharacterized protein n=1 Tax=Arundo donax TaxID=35708 RepID=A0A0A9AA08_ARUDO
MVLKSIDLFSKTPASVDIILLKLLDAKVMSHVNQMS